MVGARGGVFGMDLTETAVLEFFYTKSRKVKTLPVPIQKSSEFRICYRIFWSLEFGRIGCVFGNFWKQKIGYCSGKFGCKFYVVVMKITCLEFLNMKLLRFFRHGGNGLGVE